jgi:hypothetical protein
MVHPLIMNLMVAVERIVRESVPAALNPHNQNSEKKKGGKADVFIIIRVIS